MILERVRFDDAAQAEQTLWRGALAGVGGLGAAAVAGLMMRPAGDGPVALGFSAAALVVLLPKLSRGLLVWLLLAALGVMVILPLRSERLPFVMTLALGLVLATEVTSWPRRALALLGPTLGGAWGLWVLQWLPQRHLGAFSFPLSLVALAAIGLFVAVGATLSQVSVLLDDVEHSLAAHPKASVAWLRLRAALKRVPAGPARSLLVEVCTAGARQVAEAGTDEQRARSSIDRGAEADARSAVKALGEKLEETKDGELRGHLQQLLRVHGDTLEQLDGLERQRARAEARAAAATGWLETAAFSLELAPKTEAGLLDLAQRLRALSPGATPFLPSRVEGRAVF